VEALRDAAGKTPDDGEAWHLLGAALLEQGAAAEAGKAFARATKARNAYPQAGYYTALLSLAESRPRDAQTAIAVLVRDVPTCWEGRLLLAWVGTNVRTGAAAALREAEALVAEDPANPRAARVLIECLRATGHTERAADEEEALARLLREEPGAKRRLDEFLAVTRGEYLPVQRIGTAR
jgi:cytochrome c-type biogenesis protein CcmH/NrfG